MEMLSAKEVSFSHSRRASGNSRKLYEEMLMQEMQGDQNTSNHINVPQHAVLESGLDAGSQNVRDHALIHYLASLANSNKSDDTFDFQFVASLVRNGADINSTDKTGQTIFHEVARAWNTDVATFLIKNGANINQQDEYGRSPLHVAAAVDYAEMVEFLLKLGADIDIKTKDEEQTAVHFAAKNDAIKALEMLLGYGANIDARDSKNRTPLQVAAQMNRAKAAKFLVSSGAPAAVHDKYGNTALSLLIEKIPDVALLALDQFYSADIINRKEYYFLNYLEGARLQEFKTKARSPLDIAVQNERFDVILHPVMQRLVSLKWKMYGQRGAILDLVLNLLYAIVWTILGVKIPRHGRDLYMPLQTHVWRLFAGAFIILFTLLEIKWQVTNTVKLQRHLKSWREWRAKQLEEDLEFCHPRWPQENKFLAAEIKAVRNLSLIHGSDCWIYFDWISLVLILGTITTHVLFFALDTDAMKGLHQHTMIPLIMVLWLRIFKYARPFESAGPYVVILGHVLGDILKWFILNSIIVIPFSCAFWITFGAGSLHPVPGYETVGALSYNMFSMMVVGDHNFKGLLKENAILARLLCGSFIGIAAIVTVNLLIALLSNTFERLHENAVANAVMQRARTILLQQKSLRRKQKQNYYNFIRKKGSPEVVNNRQGMLCHSAIEDHATIERVFDEVRATNAVLDERFGRRFGKDKKSDMDYLKEDLNSVRKHEERLTKEVDKIKSILQEIAEKLFHTSGRTRHHYHHHSNHSDHDNHDDDDASGGAGVAGNAGRPMARPPNSSSANSRNGAGKPTDHRADDSSDSFSDIHTSRSNNHEFVNRRRGQNARQTRHKPSDDYQHHTRDPHRHQGNHRPPATMPGTTGYTNYQYAPDMRANHKIPPSHRPEPYIGPQYPDDSPRVSACPPKMHPHHYRDLHPTGDRRPLGNEVPAYYGGDDLRNPGGGDGSAMYPGGESAASTCPGSPVIERNWQPQVSQRVRGKDAKKMAPGEEFLISVVETPEEHSPEEKPEHVVVSELFHPVNLTLLGGDSEKVKLV